MTWWAWGLVWVALSVALGPWFGRLLERRRHELDEAIAEERRRGE